MKKREQAGRSPPDQAAMSLESALMEVAADVRRWTMRYLGPGYDLDDATQEALIEIAGAFERFEGRSSFRTFAYRIAIRSASRWSRKRRARVSRAHLSLVPADGGCDNPEQRSLHRDVLRRLHEHITKLPEANRRALILHIFEGVSHEEGAEREGTLPRTFRARVARAKTQLTRRLKRDPALSDWLGEEA